MFKKIIKQIQKMASGSSERRHRSRRDSSDRRRDYYRRDSSSDRRRDYYRRGSSSSSRRYKQSPMRGSGYYKRRGRSSS